MQRTLETQEQEEKIIQLKIKLQILAETSTREDIQMGNKNIRKCFTSYIPSGKGKLKQGATMTHLTEHPESRTLTTPNAGKGSEEQKLSFISSGNIKCFSQFERQFSCLFVCLFFK